MDAIILTDDQYVKLQQQLEEIKSQLARVEKKEPLSEAWLDNDEASSLLRVSKRTMQGYRDQGKLAFSQIQAKIYYKASDIESFLQKHYKKAFAK